MDLDGVSWRRSLGLLLAVVLAAGVVLVVARSDGLPSLDASASRATHWFVHQPTGTVVLVDGYGGRALAQVDAGFDDAATLSVVESRAGAYVLDERAAQAKVIDTGELGLGSATRVAALTQVGTVTGVGPAGLVVVDPATDEAAIVSGSGDTVPFGVEADATEATLVSSDGAVWSLVGNRLVRSTSTGSSSTRVTAGADLTLVGTDAAVLDRDGRRARFHDGSWVDLPDGVDSSELRLQQPSASGRCAWVGGGDDLWCVGRDGIERTLAVAGLDVGALDLLAVAGDTGVVVRRSPPAIDRFDPLTGVLLPRDADVGPDAALHVVTTSELVFVDDVGGDVVWAVSPWRIAAVRKDDAAALRLDETGEVVGGATGGDGDGEATVGEGEEQSDLDRLPDDNGIDDPPRAFDDPVSARAGSPVQVVVTANDFDPDGEAVAVVGVGAPSHGAVDVGTAAMVVYQPRAGFVGVDRFTYTIADGNGTTATAEVLVELLPADAVNTAPVAKDDRTETVSGAPVIVDVLDNDADKERDAVRIASFTQPETPGAGEVTQTSGRSQRPALRYVPPPDFDGAAVFTYRTIDAFDALSEPATVTVFVSRRGGANRDPVARPDSARLRRNTAFVLPVAANDRDPDGDPLIVTVPQPPQGVDVVVDGGGLRLIARAAAASLVPFTYRVDDGAGGSAIGTVLLVVVGEQEPNRAPVVTADTATAVAGESTTIDVLANDTDPDNDTLTVVSVTQPGEPTGQATIEGNRIRFAAAPRPGDEPATTRFRYQVSDGNGHVVSGDVSVRVLPEALADPPYARDDSASTYQDLPVTIDVLRNDGDPSGGRPALAGAPSCTAGSAVRTEQQRVTYTPPPGLLGVFRCTYEVVNRTGGRASASIVVSVEQVPDRNQLPVVPDRRVPVARGETVPIDLLEGVSDPDGPASALRVISATAPTIGTVARAGSILTYTAPATTGIANVSFQVSDGAGGVTPGRLVIVVVEPVRLPPIAADDVLRTRQGDAPLTAGVLDNDSDTDGDVAALRLQGVTRVSGEASVDRLPGGRSLRIEPAPSFLGDVVVDYVVVDPDGLTDVGRLVVTVERPPNRAPVATDDANQVANGASVVTAVLFNDLDADADPLTVRIVSGASTDLGTATVRSDGSIAFSATPGRDGTALIRYEVSDGVLTAQATLAITVLPCPAGRPLAPDVVLLTGYQQPITIDLAAYAVNGSVVDVGPPLGAPAGTITPPAGENGVISFPYSVVNVCRQRANGTVSIDVNQEPVAQPVSLALGRREERVLPVSDLATDLEPLSIVSVDGAPPWVTVADGVSLRLAPSGAPGSTATFSVTVQDPGGLRATVPVSVEVINRAPVANADAVDVTGGAATFDPLVNDLDPDGDPITVLAFPASVVLSDGVTVAEFERLGDGSIRVSTIGPPGGGGVATVEYTVADDTGLVSAPGTVTLRANRSPVAGDVNESFVAGETRAVGLPASDPDGDALAVALADVPDELVVAVDGLTLTITVPTAPSQFAYEFSYTVTDPSGAAATGRVNLAVFPDPSTTTTTTTPGTGDAGGGG